MQPRPSLVTLSLATLAAVHAWWGAKLVLASSPLLACTQLATAGALLLAALGARDRGTLAVGLALAAGATAVRLVALDGPFFAATAALAAGYAASAWGLARDADDATTGLARRGGLALAGLAYLSFLALSFAFGAPSVANVVDLVLRAGAAFLAAASLDAPALVRRNGFADDASSATR